MEQSRITRKNITALQGDHENWPSVDISDWPQEQQTRFNRLKSALVAYLDGELLRDIRAWHGVGCNQILEQLERCLTPDPDGRLKGWRGLIKHSAVKQYQRKKTTTRGPEILA